MTIKAGIIVFPGTNCERDTARACEFFDWEVAFINHDEEIRGDYDIIFLPGGFSYGDHISSGRIAKLSRAVKSLPVGKSLIVGICNGFQILCEAGLLPGALTDNEGIHFISKVTPLKFGGQTINLPIAHHQGNYVLGTRDKGLETSRDVVSFLKYSENVNGSDDGIAGIIDHENRIIGLMPHPERAVHEELGLTDGRKIFEFFATLI